MKEFKRYLEGVEKDLSRTSKKYSNREIAQGVGFVAAGIHEALNYLEIDKKVMSLRRLSILVSAELMMTAISGVSAVFGDSSTPPNYIGVNIGPIITTVSYNYDFLTGEVTLGTTTATALAVNNVFLTVVSDP